MQEFCPHCKSAIPQGVNFCPNCGHQIREPKLTTGKKIGLYIFSILVPPFGIIPAIRYLRNSDPSTKKVGTILLVLSILSFAVNLWIGIYFMNTLNATINKQLNGATLGL